MSRATFLKIFCGCLVFCVITFKYVHCTDSFWHSYKFGTGYGNREELIVTEVLSDNSFDVGFNVTNWKSISVGNKSVALGLMPSGVTLLIAELNKANGTFTTTAKLTELNAIPMDAVLLHHWNPILKLTEIIVVIATDGENFELEWFRVNSSHALEKFWSWPLFAKISHMNFFKMDSSCKLLLINENPCADLYEFILNEEQPNFWLTQTIPLKYGAKSSAINMYGQDFYLSIPQNRKVLIYKHKSERFMNYQNLTSYDVNWVTSFQIGFKSFLAIGGDNASIYQFTKNGILKEQIVDSNLNEIKFWFPVPVKTYRDDVILLMQRTLNYGSHTSFVVEIVLYNGGKFVIHDEVTCSYYDEPVTGLKCLIDENSDTGIIGATVLSIGNNLGILVPKKEASSGLFMVHTKMRQLASPVTLEIQKLWATKEKLMNMVNYRKNQENRIQKNLAESIKLDEDNVIKAPWQIKKLSAPIVMDDKGKPFKASAVSKPALTFSDLERQLLHVSKEIKKIQATLGTLVDSAKKEHHFRELIVNDVLDVHGETTVENAFIERINDNAFNDILNDVVRTDELRFIPSHKIFMDIHTENITFEKVNGKNEEFVLKTNSSIVTRKNIIFKRPVEVAGDVFVNGTVNNMVLQDEIIQPNVSYNGVLNFTHVRVNKTLEVNELNSFPIHSNLIFNGEKQVKSQSGRLDYDIINISGNLTVDEINGENFTEFLSCLRLKTSQSFIQGDVYFQNVLIKNNMSTKYLNNLNFPEAYVFQDSNKFTIISGKKNFTNRISAKEVKTGLINGIDPNNFVTLSTNQTIPGNFTFKDLEITENLKVDGKIFRPDVNNLRRNLTLRKANKITSNVNFKNLEITGKITVTNKLNGKSFIKSLSNVVYKDEKRPIIKSLKEFPAGFTVMKNINLTSNSINGIPLNSFISRDTDQNIAVASLNGNVTFENLHSEGLCDGINITELDENVVKLNGQQFISASLNFKNELETSNLEILKELNGLSEKDYFYTTGDREFETDITFKNVQVGDINIEGKLIGEISGFDIGNYESQRLSLSKDQILSGEFLIDNATVEQFNAGHVNGIPFGNLTGANRYTRYITNKLLAGELKIKELYVNGPLFIEKLNSVNVSDFSENFIWTDRNNNLRKTLIVTGDVYFKSVQIKYFNDVNFENFVENIVYKNETNLKLGGFKTFTNGFHVGKLLQTQYLNDIDLDDILLERKSQEIHSPIDIYSMVIINSESSVKEYLNDVSIERLGDTFKFIKETCVVNGDLLFERLTYVDRLFVTGDVNGVNVQNFFKSMVKLTADHKVPGGVTFEGPVYIAGNLDVATKINNIDLSDFKEDVVLRNEDIIIDGEVEFTKPVHIEKLLKLTEDLFAQFLCDIDLQTWKDNPAFINQGPLSGQIAFKSVTIRDDINVKYINDINMDTLIPLRTKQIIRQTLKFGEVSVFSNITVNNLINGINLQKEHSNTLMNNGYQEIYSNVTFTGNALIRDKLNISSTINDFNLSQIVTTNTDQNLSARYEFSDKITFEKNLNVYGNINGINFTDWSERSVQKRMESPQNIEDNWKVVKNITFRENVSGVGLLTGLDLNNVTAEIEKKRHFKLSVENRLIESYLNVCSSLNDALRGARNQIYLFKHFEFLQKLDVPKNIENVHYFKHQNVNYILINEVGNCLARLYSWSHLKFTLTAEVETGFISQLISVKQNGSLYLVSRSNATSSPCAIEGSNVWKFEEENLLQLYKLENQLILQDSLIPGAFYGLDYKGVTEYRLTNTFLKDYQKWAIVKRTKNEQSNLAFIPRGLKIGLALRDGHKLYRLARNVQQTEHEFDYQIEAVIKGNFTEEINFSLPGRKGGDITIINVGVPSRRKTLMAVAVHEQMSVKSKLDFIKFYEDVLGGALFHKVPTYKPTSLISLDFGYNGETLLVFLEDQKTLQAYEYKGIEGFKYRTSARVDGSKLIPMILPMGQHKTERKIVGVVNKNSFTLLEVVMVGNQISEEELSCNIP